LTNDGPSRPTIEKGFAAAAAAASAGKNPNTKIQFLL
jgi:hypothetical protein